MQVYLDDWRLPRRAADLIDEGGLGGADTPGAGSGAGSGSGGSGSGGSGSGGFGSLLDKLRGGGSSGDQSDVVLNAVGASADALNGLLATAGRTVFIIGVVVGAWMYRKELKKFFSKHKATAGSK